MKLWEIMWKHRNKHLKLVECQKRFSPTHFLNFSSSPFPFSPCITPKGEARTPLGMKNYDQTALFWFPLCLLYWSLVFRILCKRKNYSHNNFIQVYISLFLHSKLIWFGMLSISAFTFFVPHLSFILRGCPPSNIRKCTIPLFICTFNM